MLSRLMIVWTKAPIRGVTHIQHVVQINHYFRSWISISLPPELGLPYLKGPVALLHFLTLTGFSLVFGPGPLNGGDDSACITGILV